MNGYNPYELNSFSRTVANEQKMGAYYTDVIHCRSIARMFKWPAGEVCVLEPSIGDGSAVIAVTGAEENPDVKIYGVELNDAVAAETAENPLITACVKADFLEDFTARRDAFSFCFANPPYLQQKDAYGHGVQRTEKAFLLKINDYLKKGAILVWVVPQSVFFEPGHVRAWIKDYETYAVFKFRGAEFEKYHQVVAVARKRGFRAVQPDDVTKFAERWLEDGIPELPDDLEPQIAVLPSQSEKIDMFTTKIFDSELASNWLKKNGLGEALSAKYADGITESPYLPSRLGRPAIPLKKDSEYLLLTSGFTDGLVGSEEEGNVHLMRGVARVVDHERVQTSIDEETDEVKSQKIVVTTSTEIEVRIIESNGKIRLLGGEEKEEEENVV